MNEKRLIRMIQKVTPAVVSVIASHHLEELESAIPRGKRNAASRTKKRLHELADSQGLIQTGGGSGFIVDSNGTIVTNRHVVGDEHAEYTVVYEEGKTFPAEVVSRDMVKDVAILKIDAEHLPTIPLGSASELKLGQGVIAIGNALGLFEDTVSFGIISGLSRSIQAQGDPEAPLQEMRGLIQTDAAINPGNSGGPLVDLKGRVIGINAAIAKDAQGIGFAIPIDAARRDLEDLRRYGHVRQPYLGIRYVVTDDGAWITGEHPGEPGVIEGSPAAKSGLRDHDIILAWNGEHITREHPLREYLDNASVGENVTLLVLRKEKKFEVKTTLTEKK